jgi:hypothetical protein
MQQCCDSRVFVRAAGEWGFNEVITDENNSPIYLRTSGKATLAFATRNSRGTASIITRIQAAVGKWKHVSIPDCLRMISCTPRDCEGRKAKLDFVSV